MIKHLNDNKGHLHEWKTSLYWGSDYWFVECKHCEREMHNAEIIDTLNEYETMKEQERNKKGTSKGER